MIFFSIAGTAKSKSWILGKDSPVFDELFSNEDFEKTRVMKIEAKDLKPTVEVLQFIYKVSKHSKVLTCTKLKQ